MPDHLPTDECLARDLRRERLTFAQRRRHLDRLDAAFADDLDDAARRHRSEFGFLAAVLAIALVGLAIWTFVLDSTDFEDIGAVDSPSQISPAYARMPGATVVADTPPIVTPGYDATLGVCNVSATALDVDPAVPRNNSQFLNWYGNREAGLWVAPQDFGAFLAPSWRRPASLWFAASDMHVNWFGASSAVVVAANRLDGNSQTNPVVAERSGPDAPELQSAVVTFPATGCWELTGTAGQQQLSIVVDVLPFASRPDVAIAENFYAARPYDTPDTCPVTARITPTQRGAGHHWLQSGNLRAEFNDLLFAGDEQTVGITGADVIDGLEMIARKLNSDQPEQEMALTPLWNSDARLAIFSIPSSGCWELDLETPTRSVTFVVYVYPAECKPALRDGEFVSACQSAGP